MFCSGSLHTFIWSIRYGSRDGTRRHGWYSAFRPFRASGYGSFLTRVPQSSPKSLSAYLPSLHSRSWVQTELLLSGLHSPAYSLNMEFFNDNGTDPLKPSLFELIAQEQLRDMLQPALKYVLAVCNAFPLKILTDCLQVFAQRYPRYLLRIVNRHEEFYAFIMLMVERHYLRKHSSCFVSATRCKL